MLLTTRTRLRSREQVGWVMREGLVAFERVRDWEHLDCQRHICEIQGPFIRRICTGNQACGPKLTDLYRKPVLSTYEREREGAGLGGPGVPAPHLRVPRSVWRRSSPPLQPSNWALPKRPCLPLEPLLCEIQSYDPPLRDPRCAWLNTPNRALLVSQAALTQAGLRS